LYIPVDTFKLETILDLSKVPELKATDMQQRYFLTLGAALRLEEKVL
jgi:MSHA biogenesis protein MshI